MVTMNAHEISLERGRLWIVLATIAINIVNRSIKRVRIRFWPRFGAPLTINGAAALSFAKTKNGQQAGTISIFNDEQIGKAYESKTEDTGSNISPSGTK
jgi:hypothetical protein